MKKFYFLFAIFFFSICGAQIINFPDANFKAKLLQSDVTNSIAKDVNGNNIKIDTNSNNEIETNEALNVYKLEFYSNIITDLTGISNFSNLRIIKMGNLVIVSNLNFTGLINLEIIELSGFTSVQTLDVSNLPNLQNLKINYFDNLTNLNIQNVNNLNSLTINTNTILNNLTLSNFPALTVLNCTSNNGLTNFSISNCPLLNELNLGNNSLVSFNYMNLPLVQSLLLNKNELTSLDLANLPKLVGLSAVENHLTSIDFSQNPFFLGASLSDNNLQFINVKNGNPSTPNLGVGLNNSLQFICCDTEDALFIDSNLYQLGINNVVINSYCSFTPGGTFYTIQGNTKYDINNNGCDISDPKKAYQKFNITNGTVSGSVISNSLGEYSIPVQAGSHTITPILENPNYFNISPTNLVANFPTQTSSLNQDFCLTANGNHNDLEIVIIPLLAARPGFSAKYKILYKNKGTSAQTGNFTFNYDDSLMNYVNASIAPTSQSTGVLNYDFVNLLPFQVREITVSFTLNTPTATPPLIGGQILNYTAQINGFADETPLDNTFTLNQTVVNSFDPNDKTCLEGTQISQTKVGDYVHYLIRFENTGTANAQNIVVKDIIDTSKFDINSLVAMSGSHSFVTRITNPNTVEFIFEGIQLPFNDLYNDGYVSFKIKTKSTLVLGDSFSNTANIYFDYNAPIVTNTATTTVANILGSSEISAGKDQMEFYPNPVENVINFKGKESVIKIEVYDVSGRIVLSRGVKNNVTDVSGLKTGNYFLKIYTKDQYYINKMVKK